MAIEVHEVVMFPLQTNFEGVLDPDMEQALGELFEYGYIYRWINDETGEWQSATYETPPGPHPTASQYNAWLRHKIRFPNGPWKFPDTSKSSKRLRLKMLKGLKDNVHDD